MSFPHDAVERAIALATTQPAMADALRDLARASASSRGAGANQFVFSPGAGNVRIHVAGWSEPGISLDGPARFIMTAYDTDTDPIGEQLWPLIPQVKT
jgi:hypothetical protein